MPQASAEIPSRIYKLSSSLISISRDPISPILIILILVADKRIVELAQELSPARKGPPLNGIVRPLTQNSVPFVQRGDEGVACGSHGPLGSWLDRRLAFGLVFPCALRRTDRKTALSVQYITIDRSILRPFRSMGPFREGQKSCPTELRGAST